MTEHNANPVTYIMEGMEKELKKLDFHTATMIMGWIRKRT